MAGNELRYDQMIEEALRGVLRRALRQVATAGLPGNHHFFVTFKTAQPGVQIPSFLREKYPDEMTIVLQYQFWNLEVEAERFGVTLSFSEVPERLVIPFAAVTSFADPAAKFGLQFQHQTGATDVDEGEDAKPLPALQPSSAKPDAASGDEPAPAGDGDSKVVALDAFRRK